MFVAAMRTSQDWKLDNYLIYSDDEGKTWQVSDHFTSVEMSRRLYSSLTVLSS